MDNWQTAFCLCVPFASLPGCLLYHDHFHESGARRKQEGKMSSNFNRSRQRTRYRYLPVTLKPASLFLVFFLFCPISLGFQLWVGWNELGHYIIRIVDWVRLIRRMKTWSLKKGKWRMSSHSLICTHSVLSSVGTFFSGTSGSAVG